MKCIFFFLLDCWFLISPECITMSFLVNQRGCAEILQFLQNTYPELLNTEKNSFKKSSNQQKKINMSSLNFGFMTIELFLRIVLLTEIHIQVRGKRKNKCESCYNFLIFWPTIASSSILKMVDHLEYLL